MRSLIFVSFLLLLSGCCSISEKYCCKGLKSFYTEHDLRMDCEKALKEENLSESRCGEVIKGAFSRKNIAHYRAESNQAIYNFEQCLNNGNPLSDELMNKIAEDIIVYAKSEQQQYRKCYPLTDGTYYIAHIYNCPNLRAGEQ